MTPCIFIMEKNEERIDEMLKICTLTVNKHEYELKKEM